MSFPRPSIRLRLKCLNPFRWEAAYGYRAAIDNGLSPIGLSWVYKVSCGELPKPIKPFDNRFGIAGQICRAKKEREGFQAGHKG